MFGAIQTYLWGNVSRQEAKKNTLLSFLFFLIVGAFWLLGSLQVPLFYHIVGSYYHPRVNIITFLCVTPLMLLYIYLLERVNKMRLFVGIALFYVCFFVIAGLFLLHPVIGLANVHADPWRLLGWVIYAGIQTYGTLLVSMFWALATSITDVKAAKKSFPVIIVCAQFGPLIGSTLARSAQSYGIPTLMFIGAMAIGVVAALFYYLQEKYVPVRNIKTHQSRFGVIEGLTLIFSRSYLRGVLIISTGFLVITALLDYQMHLLAHVHYTNIEQFTWFKGIYGQCVIGFTLLFSLFGTNALLRWFGVRVCLVLYPLITAVCVTLIAVHPSLWVLFGSMILLRGLAFALNTPTKEIVYIPEDADVRFKARSWIDMFGYRGAFALGSELTDLFKSSFGLLVLASTVISYGVILIWLYSAWVVGRRFVIASKHE